MKITLQPASGDDIEVIVRGNPADSRVSDLLQMLRGMGTVSKLFLYRGEKEYLVEIGEIAYFEAGQNKVFAHVGTQEFEVRYKLYELEEMARPKGFIRISKGVIVNVNAVLSVEAEFSGNYCAVLKGSRERVSISRKYIREFRRFILEVF